MEDVDNQAQGSLTTPIYTLEDIDRIDSFRNSILDFEKQLVNFEHS